MAIIRQQFNYPQSVKWFASHFCPAYESGATNVIFHQEQFIKDKSRARLFYLTDIGLFLDGWQKERMCYTQGDLYSGQLPNLILTTYAAWYPERQIAAHGLAELSFGFINDKGERCAFCIVAPANTLEKWVLSITKNNDKIVLEERETILFYNECYHPQGESTESSQKTTIRLTPTTIETSFLTALESKDIAEILKGIIQPDGFLNLPKINEIEKKYTHLVGKQYDEIWLNQFENASNTNEMLEAIKKFLSSLPEDPATLPAHTSNALKKRREFISYHCGTLLETTDELLVFLQENKEIPEVERMKQLAVCSTMRKEFLSEYNDQEEKREEERAIEYTDINWLNRFAVVKSCNQALKEVDRFLSSRKGNSTDIISQVYNALKGHEKFISTRDLWTSISKSTKKLLTFLPKSTTLVNDHLKKQLHVVATMDVICDEHKIAAQNQKKNKRPNKMHNAASEETPGISVAAIDDPDVETQNSKTATQHQEKNERPREMLDKAARKAPKTSKEKKDKDPAGPFSFVSTLLGGGTGANIGLGIGFAIGTKVGLALAPLTFCISILVGAVVGGAAGWFIGRILGKKRRADTTITNHSAQTTSSLVVEYESTLATPTASRRNSMSCSKIYNEISQSTSLQSINEGRKSSIENVDTTDPSSPQTTLLTDHQTGNSFAETIPPLSALATSSKQGASSDLSTTFPLAFKVP